MNVFSVKCRVVIGLAAMAACFTGVCGDDFTVASFNLRFDNAKDKGDNEWKLRQPRIVQVIRQGGFDIIGFQELIDSMRPAFTNALKEYRFSDSSKKTGPVPIAFRPEKFEFVDSARMSLSEHPEDFTCKSWGATSARICQWVLLREKKSGRLIRHFNMHPDWKGQKSRTLGMKQVVVPLIREAEARGELVILTGDMNEDPGVPRPQWLPEDAQYPWGEAMNIVKLHLKDAFEASATPPRGPALTAHCFSEKRHGRIDRIFVSKGIGVKAFTTHDDRPGGKYPSDHDAISARISL